MSRIVYVNGQWLAEENAMISIFDRAVLFADAIYEVTCVIDRKLIDFSAHMKRLKRSLGALNIQFSVSEHELLERHRLLAEKNNLTDGCIYLQISRGAVDRDFLLNNNVEPSFFMFTQPIGREALLAVRPLKMLSVAEGRWLRRDIKTTQLLYASLKKSSVTEQGCDDAVFVENGYITEASAANFYMVDHDDIIITRPLDGTVLPGITRARLLTLARDHGITVIERAFTLEEALSASELFISSATKFAMPVIALDGRTISDGKIGKLTARLRQLYLDNLIKL